MLHTGEMTHSSASLSFVMWPRRSPVTGTRKFSVNSSERPTVMKMNAMPKPSAPSACAGCWPIAFEKAAVIVASAMTPKTTSMPATSAVEEISRRERASRRLPSSRVRSKISCGSGAMLKSGEDTIAGYPPGSAATRRQWQALLPADGAHACAGLGGAVGAAAQDDAQRGLASRARQHDADRVRAALALRRLRHDALA